LPFGIRQVSCRSHPQLVGDPLQRSQLNVNANNSEVFKQALRAISDTPKSKTAKSPP
jgi:hypothetical protein